MNLSGRRFSWCPSYLFFALELGHRGTSFAQWAIHQSICHSSYPKSITLKALEAFIPRNFAAAAQSSREAGIRHSSPFWRVIDLSQPLDDLTVVRPHGGVERLNKPPCTLALRDVAIEEVFRVVIDRRYGSLSVRVSLRRTAAGTSSYPPCTR